MKKLLVTLAAVLVSASTFGQGTILFNTRVTGQVDAPVSRPDGTGAGAGWNAQLFLVTGSGATTAYTPLNPATTFRTTSAAAAFYVVQPAGPVIVPTVAPGQQATIVLRAWEGAVGSSYDVSFMKGVSNPITITLGGVPAVGAPIQDAVLVGLQPFQLVPEPSTMALGFLGAAALLSRRRAYISNLLCPPRNQIPRTSSLSSAIRMLKTTSCPSANFPVSFSSAALKGRAVN